MERLLKAERGFGKNRCSLLALGAECKLIIYSFSRSVGLLHLNANNYNCAEEWRAIASSGGDPPAN